MVVGCKAGFGDEQAASPTKVLVAIRPNIEILPRFSAMQAHEHIFNNVTSFSGRVEQGSEKYLLRRCQEFDVSKAP